VRLTATYRGGEDPFEGDRTLLLRLVPQGARILAARVTVTPALAEEETEPVEHLDFDDPDSKLWGATRAQLRKDIVAVDFHARWRLATLVGVSSADPATLEVDLGGGVFVRVSATGAIDPEDSGWVLLNNNTNDNPVPLPPLEVAGIILQGTDGDDVTVSRVTVRRVPRNVTVALGRLGPFLVALGELISPVTSTDFAAILQGFLATAEVAAGVYVVPLVLHSDALAQLDVVVELDVALSQALLPEGVPDVLLDFDHAGVPKASAGALEVMLPPGARVTSAHTRARVNGAFDATRVAVGPLGHVEAPARALVAAKRSQAQPIVLAEDRTVVACDLLLTAAAGGGRASATLLADADGKPFGDPLVPPAPLRLDAATPEPRWVNVPLAAPFQLRAGTVYWLVLTVLAGELAWAAQPAAPGAPVLQQSLDGGLSWRQTADATTPAPWAATFRLRETPDAFRMPIELRSGGLRLGLERFEPLGRVDFSLDPADLAGFLGEALGAAAQAACASANHLANGDFSRWIEDGTTVIAPEEWELTAGTVLRSGNLDAKASLGAIDDFSGLSQVTPVSPGCMYALELVAGVKGDEATAEIIWLRGDCRDTRIDRIHLPPTATGTGRILHRGRFRAPEDATQAEVRFLVPPRSTLCLDDVRLAATDNVLLDGDLGEAGDPEDPVPGWTQGLDRPLVDGETISVGRHEDGTDVRNESEAATLTLTQRTAVEAAQRWSLAVSAVARGLTAGAAAPAVELRWIAGGDVPTAPDVVVPVSPPAFDGSLSEGEVPVGVAEAEVRLVVPPRASLKVHGIALRVVEPIRLPVDVVAQAPGRLTVSDAVVAYDVVAPDPPGVPASGLCTPTPPGEDPGGTEHCDHCPSCGQPHELTRAVPMLTSAGRPAIAGRCRGCRTTITHLGGPIMPAVGRDVGPRLAPVLSFEPVVRERFGRRRLVTEVSGIGEGRADRLERAGIRSLRDLAALSPQRVAGVLGLRGTSGSESLVSEARRLLATDPPDRPDPGQETRRL
jgi:hypothetical protein